MKKGIKASILGLMTVCVMGLSVCHAEAAPSECIEEGVYLGDIDLSGLTVDEAEKKVNSYINELKQVPITLIAVDDQTVETTAGELGVEWNQGNVLKQAAALGKKGNVLTRYKELMSLKHENKFYDIKLSLDEKKARSVILSKCSIYDKEAEDASLKRADGKFIIEGGQVGEKTSVPESVNAVKDYLTNSWNGSEGSIKLVVTTEVPKGDAESLKAVKDVLGTHTTSYSTSGADRSKNVSNGCAHINGITLFPGEEFSAYQAVSPFSEENGYALAGSYANGLVVESFGGGICQVSTTLYNAVLKAELEVTERHNHSMEVSYVKPSMDAAIAESAGKDFKFKNSTKYPIYIEGYTHDKNITFTIYGVETRDPGHAVSYESEVVKETVPEGEKIITDSSQPIGFVKTQSVHVGKQAKLWKITTENGKEVSREVVNTSNYSAVPRTATVGTATSDPAAAAILQNAIATGSIDQVKSVAGALKSGDLTPIIEAAQAAQAAQAAEQAAEAAAAGNAGTP